MWSLIGVGTPPPMRFEHDTGGRSQFKEVKEEFASKLKSILTMISDSSHSSVSETSSTPQK